MERQHENLTVTRADLAEFMRENGDDPLDVYDFLIDRGLSPAEAERALSTLDSY